MLAGTERYETLCNAPSRLKSSHLTAATGFGSGVHFLFDAPAMLGGQPERRALPSAGRSEEVQAGLSCSSEAGEEAQTAFTISIPA